MGIVSSTTAAPERLIANMDTSDSVRTQIAHLYRRAGWGATNAELDAGVAVGYRATVEMLLTADDPSANAVPQPILTPSWLFNLFADINGIEALQCIRWWLQRAVVSKSPLREKLPWFWHNLLTSSADNARPIQMFQQNQLFRTHGWGNVEEFYKRVSINPAMMLYLNLEGSHRNHPNENYARELLELFGTGRTGVGGVANYTEDDVKAAARAMTGWKQNFFQDGAEFNSSAWDNGSKTFLGQTGNWNLNDIVRIVVNSPASKRWIPTKVWTFFAYPIGVGSSIITDLSNGYTNSAHGYTYAGYSADLNMQNLLRAVFLHPEFQSAACRTGLYKSPIDWAISAFKYLRIPVSEATVTPLGAMGQIPFQPPNVAGWPPNAFWITTVNFQIRGNLAAASVMLGDTSPVDSAPIEGRVDACRQMLGIDQWSPTTAAALADSVLNTKQLVATALMSPEFCLS